MPKMEPHESSMTSHHGFDEKDGGLHLKFKGSGAVYSYAISPELYAEYQAAKSKGQFFNQKIKPHFEGKKVSG